MRPSKFTLVWTVLGFLSGGFLMLNFEKLLEANGWDQFAVKASEASGFEQFFSRPIVFILAAVMVGVAIGLWVATLTGKIPVGPDKWRQLGDDMLEIVGGIDALQQASMPDPSARIRLDAEIGTLLSRADRLGLMIPRGPRSQQAYVNYFTYVGTALSKGEREQAGDHALRFFAQK